MFFLEITFIPNGHVGVHCEYYSILVRYERPLFLIDKDLVIRILPKILSTILDERGINHQKSNQARTYTCVAFSRIIRTLLNNSSTLIFLTENNAGEEILKSVCANIGNEQLYSASDRLSMFEVAGLAASRITKNPENWITMLVRPCLEQFKTKVSNANENIAIQSIVDEDLESANHYIQCIIRTSKAFTAKFSMESKNCETIFLESLNIFLETFKLPEKLQEIIRPNIKQFIHKMVLCLQKHIDSMIVPALLEAVENSIKLNSSNNNTLLSTKLLLDIIPILSQIIQKHTKDLKIHNFSWNTLVRVCFEIWETNLNINDEEILLDCKYIRRHCYNIIMIAIQNKKFIEELFLKNGNFEEFREFLMFLNDGIVTSKYCDAQTIRNSLLALNFIMKEWMTGNNSLIELFVVEICPTAMVLGSFGFVIFLLI